MHIIFGGMNVEFDASMALETWFDFHESSR